MRRPSLIDVRGVYAILDLPYRAALAPAEVAAALLAGGARILQLRAKHADAEQRREWAAQLAGPCRAAGAALIINDDLELAESGLLGIAGVHLGQGDLERLGQDLPSRQRRRARLRERGLALGVSTHDLDQLRRAVAELEPDYLGFGPVFATTSKQNPDPVVGLDGLARACVESPVPVVAIGGVDSTRAPELARIGVPAIAAIAALSGERGEIIRAKTAEMVRRFA